MQLNRKEDTDVSDYNSWQVCISNDVELNFLLYVARTYGLLKEDPNDQIAWPSRQIALPDQLHQDLELQWNILWNHSIQLKGSKNNIDYKFLLGLPNFERIEKQGLRIALVNLWPVFSQWWNMPAGGQIAMQFWERQPDLTHYVQEFEYEVERKIKTIRLNVDLIYTGYIEPSEVNEEYIIMPIRTEYLLKKDWWMKRFRGRY